MPSTKKSAGKILYRNMGVWDSTVTYTILDMVNYNNVIYTCKVPTSTGSIPGAASADWQKFIEQSAVSLADPNGKIAGIVKSDIKNNTTKVDGDGVMSVPHVTDDSVNNNSGVHDIRYDDTSKTLQRYDPSKKTWMNANGYKTTTTELLASKWVGSEPPYVYNNTIAEATSDVEIILSDSATKEQVEACVNAQIAGNGDNNTLRAWGDKPTVDIPILVKEVLR